jgi:hypothetical protein
MKTYKKVIWLFLFFALSKIILASPSPEFSKKWTNYTDFKNVVSISADKNSPIAYCVSNGGLFVVDIIQGTVLKTYTNIDGLVSNNLTSVYVDSLNRTWIGAADGSITILDYSKGTFNYIYDIKNSNENNKSINDFVQAGQYMFVATGYGIQKISIVNLSFVDAPYFKFGNFPTKSIVSTLSLFNSYIYAGTAAGIAYAPIISTNLNNPSSWSNYSSEPLNANIISSEVINNKIVFGSATGLGYFDGTSWTNNPNPVTTNKSIADIRKVGDNLYFIVNNAIYYSPVSNLTVASQYYVSGAYLSLSSDNSGKLLIGAFENGLVFQISNGNFISVFPNCPFRNSFDNISIGTDGILWAAGGQGDAGFYKFDGKTWESYNTTTRPEIGSSNWFRRIVAGDGVVWALGYGGGPTVIRGNSIKNFNTTNSILPGNTSGSTFCVPFGGAFDNNGNFWLSFFATGNSTNIYMNTGDSTFIPYVNPGIIQNPALEQVAIDNYNTKWVVSSGSQSGGLYFFNENGTPTNYNDDVSGIYYLSEFGVETITGVIVDRNNEVWVSTNNGVFIIHNPLGAIQNPNQKPAPEKLGIISGNLKVPFTENCTCISNDILNQKWIGTQTNGVFHLSSDGSTLIETFNVVNSPILSNQINSISVSNKDGKAYFGTLNGLSSVITDAIAPLTDFDKIICSPNPYLVPPRVNLKIDGLVENSSVKILSLSGDLIVEFTSPGGRIASWDGRDSKGNIVPTGIYLVIGFDKDGKKVGKGKLAVIKQ